MTAAEHSVPDVFVPRWLAYGQVSPRACAVYTKLLTRGELDPETMLYGQCQVTRKDFARQCGISVVALGKTLHELERRGAIVGEPGFDATRGGAPMNYRTLPEPAVHAEQGPLAPAGAES
jgi:hypothetical protein